MSSKWGKPFSKSSAKHWAPKNSNPQSTRGTGHGSKKQPSGSSSSYDDSPVHTNPITVTATATGTAKNQQFAVSKATNLKVEAERLDRPSDKDLKYAIDSLVGDPQGRRDSKEDAEYYKEQYRKLKGENDTLRDKVEDLREEVESAQCRVRVKNQIIAETNDLVNQKDRELSKLQRAQECSVEQLNAIQKRYTWLSQKMDQVEANKHTLEQSYKARVADLEQKLSETSAKLLRYNKELLKAQEEDNTVSVMEEKMKELEKNLEKSNTALQEEKERVKKRAKQLTKLDATANSYSKQLDIVKAELQEVKDSKQAVEVECQQIKAYSSKQKDKIVQLEDTMFKQAVEYASTIEKITKEKTEMQTKFATKIDELNQQVAHLQEENIKFQSLTTGATNKPSHENDQVFHSSVEQQGHIDQSAQLQKRLKELESELESTRSTLEAERKRHEEKMEELRVEISHLQFTKQNVIISGDHSPDEMDQLLNEHEGVKQTQGQIYKSYQKLKECYRQMEEEVGRLGTQYSQLQTDFEKQRAELNKAKEELKRVSGLNEFVQEQHGVGTDDYYTKVDKLTMELKQATENYCVRLVQEIKDQEKKATEAFQSRVDELSKKIAVERNATANAKNEVDKLMGQLQQLQNDKRIVEQQMNAGYKEREDTIAELKEFINDQVTKLDKMEAAMKQTVSNKQLLEEDYQKLSGYYDSAKKTVEEYQERIFAQEDTIGKLESKARQSEENASITIATLEQEKETLIQSNQKLSREVARLMLVDIELQHSKKDIEKYQLELRKAEEELQTKEFMVTELEAEGKQITADKQLLEENFQLQKAEMEQHINALQVQLEKALDPLENIEELKEVEDLGEEIGRGAYGLVKKVSVHGTTCAAKDIHAILIHYASDQELERIKKSFLEECVKCSKLFHPNIVQFLGIHYPSKQAKLPWLVMELLDCNLAGFVKKYDKESVALFVKASIFCDISLGLQFLHGRDIIHRDLSSNNVLLTKHFTAKISDLGVAKLVDSSGTKSHTVVPGTQHFLPPEVISDTAKSHYGKPIDVFSLGCIMIHVTTHEWPAPLPETHYDPRLKKKVVLSEIERREAYLNQIQELPELKILVENCLHDDPGLRPNATQMVEESGKLKIFYQSKSSFAGSEMNAVEFEKCLKLQNKRISEQQSEIQKLNKTINKPLQGP